MGKETTDILQTLSTWGLEQLENKKLDKAELRDICNKISECNVLIHNLANATDESEIALLKEALECWAKKEETPLSFKAKYR